MPFWTCATSEDVSKHRWESIPTLQVPRSRVGGAFFQRPKTEAPLWLSSSAPPTSGLASTRTDTITGLHGGHMLTAVDRDVSSGHEGGLVGAKIYNQTGDLVGCSEAPKWNLRKNL